MEDIDHTDKIHFPWTSLEGKNSVNIVVPESCSMAYPCNYESNTERANDSNDLIDYSPDKVSKKGVFYTITIFIFLILHLLKEGYKKDLNHEPLSHRSSKGKALRSERLDRSDNLWFLILSSEQNNEINEIEAYTK